MATKKLNLVMRQGETFQRVIRWEQLPFIYKAITGITQAAPAEVTAVGHGLTDGWRVAVVSVLGMLEINAKHTPPRDSDLTQVTVLDNDTVALNAINSSNFDAYVSGGYLQFYTPVPLSGYTARMKIKDRVGGTEQFSLTTENSRIAIDPSGATISLFVSAADTALFDWSYGVYDLELVSGSGFVSVLFSGNVRVTPEVTT